MPDNDALNAVSTIPAYPAAAVASASDPSHRELLGGEWWRRIPAYAEVDEATFLDHRWQTRNSVKSPNALLETMRDLVSPAFLADVEEGLRRAPMSIRVTPNILSLVNWDEPLRDPLRRQFIPVGSQLESDHPELRFDSLAELDDAAVPGLTHRYPDKALFLALDTCPVYCRFCTRSYAIGMDTERLEKVAVRPNPERWQQAFEYIAEHPELEDIVISGGDVFNLGARMIAQLGNALLDIPHVRRLRYATKGIAVMPQKILSDDAWLDALTEVVERGRREGRQVAVHTHFNAPAEITEHSQRAMDRLFRRGIIVRNQSVLQRGVNDSVADMVTLVRRLSHINVQPYYVYMHDLVEGVEDLRTSLDAGIALEKAVRGTTAGFNTPTFVVDAPGGGGKRDIHSYEHYDREAGIAVYSAPSVKPGRLFAYVDPLRTLDREHRRRWADPRERAAMRNRALREAREAA